MFGFKYDWYKHTNLHIGDTFFAGYRNNSENNNNPEFRWSADANHAHEFDTIEQAAEFAAKYWVSTIDARADYTNFIYVDMTTGEEFDHNGNPKKVYTEEKSEGRDGSIDAPSSEGLDESIRNAE